MNITVSRAEIDKKFDKERKTHADIITSDFVDTYKNLSLKVLHYIKLFVDQNLSNKLISKTKIETYLIFIMF